MVSHPGAPWRGAFWRQLLTPQIWLEEFWWMSPSAYEQPNNLYYCKFFMVFRWMDIKNLVEWISWCSSWNRSRSQFTFPDCEASYKPPELVTGSEKLRGHAVQNWCLLIVLPLFIADWNPSESVCGSEYCSWESVCSVYIYVFVFSYWKIFSNHFQTVIFNQNTMLVTVLNTFSMDLQFVQFRIKYEAALCCCFFFIT